MANAKLYAVMLLIRVSRAPDSCMKVSQVLFAWIDVACAAIAVSWCACSLSRCSLRRYFQNASSLPAGKVGLRSSGISTARGRPRSIFALVMFFAGGSE